ncbi:DUF3703 domain-containing protein [Pseudoalteromonas sp. T1lg22]|uniref:DUF3703 domain-containing protein n=1 Tax=Pseudoalteromonas sp. T1lg22 TaxID=2077096 RepID=UPI000CF6733F|nr:DUF3703 domain-containing protein [Pseudoalteromonas sp. T1lg22]
MNFTQAIRFSVLRELAQARRARRLAFSAQEFTHLENAHVLGQESTYWHTYTHWRMLVWGWQHKMYPEVAGQVLRIVGALSKTAIGLLPTGNTGGANVSPFKPMPLSPAHVQAINDAKHRCKLAN